jgi:predicted transcriptional regulator
MDQATATSPPRRVFILAAIAYVIPMSQAATPRRAAPQSWIDAIARGEADLASGRVRDLETVMREFEAEDVDGLKLAERHPDRRRAADR